MALSQEEYVEELEKTFATAGWQIIVQDWKERIDGLQLALMDPARCKNWDDVIAARAMAATLIELINLPTYLESLRE